MATQSTSFSKSTQFTKWLDVVALAAWALLLLKYKLTDEIGLLVHPRFNWVVLAASFVLLLVSGLRSWGMLRKQSLPSSQHLAALPPVWTGLLLVVTALLGLLTSPQALGSTAATQQGISDTLVSTRIQAQVFRSSTNSEDRSILQWARTLAVYPEPDRYAGQKVKVQGFVVQPPNLPDQYFVLTRFVIAHCALDAYPVGMIVKLTESRKAYPADTWLDLQGQATTETLNGKRELVVKARSLQSIPEPKTPYEYN